MNLPTTTTKKPNTPLQDAFLEALTDPEIQGNIRKAMTKAGYSENTPVKDVVDVLSDQIIALAKSMLALNAPKAVHGLISVVDTPQQLGANAKMQAASSILDRVGLAKKDETNASVPKGAIVILPPKENVKVTVEVNNEPTTIDITPAVSSANSETPRVIENIVANTH